MTRLRDWEIDFLISEIADRYGFDFSGYSKASFTRRVSRLYVLEGFSTFGEFIEKIKSSPSYLEYLVEEITVNVTEMFRDPLFYKALREQILPLLAPKPFLRIWHAGCSTGEEVVSMAILLKEANLLHKALIYATDLSQRSLEVAKEGLFPLRMMKQYSENYLTSGGKEDFSSYYVANFGHAQFDKDLISKVVFSQHNLVSDRSFNEFDLIICRNVLIYFENDLQHQTFELFDQSLSKLGFLALGSKETLKYGPLKNRYEAIAGQKIWRKLS
jgi:chemotaxis protein methyltransferase CheR